MPISVVRLSLVVLLSGCHSSGSDPLSQQRTLTPEAAAGCYRMVIGEWASTGAHHGISPPLEFRLDTASAGERRWPGTSGRAVVAPGVQTRFAGWSVGLGDTLHVNWTTGYVQGGYILVAQGDSVFGLATTRTDVRRAGIADPTAPVRGARVTCS